MSQQIQLDKQIIINKLIRMLNKSNNNEWLSDEQKLAVTGTLQGLLTEIKMGKYDANN